MLLCRANILPSRIIRRALYVESTLVYLGALSVGGLTRVFRNGPGTLLFMKNPRSGGIGRIDADASAGM